MSAADRLREAARVLRERAEAASEGEWWPYRTVPSDLDAEWIVDSGLTFICSTHIDSERGRADATYIATMHPVVGLALANWLDAQADTTCDCGVDEFALAVANLILGTAHNVDSASPF